MTRRVTSPVRPTTAATATLVTLAMLVALAPPACGGSQPSQPAAEPATAEPEPDDDIMIPAEKYDEIARFFDRKRKIITRCFTAAIDAGEISKRGSGRVTVTMTITRTGTLDHVAISLIQPESAMLQQCVLDRVKRWTVTTLPKPLDYSFTFGFGTL